MADKRENRRKRESKKKQEAHLEKILAETSYFKRETFYALENARVAKQPFKFFGYFLFVLIVLNVLVVFFTVDPETDPIASDVSFAFFVFSTICFFIEYIARIWIADLAFSNQTPARARIRYIFSVWGIIDFLAFFPSMLSWFFPATIVLRDAVNVVRIMRLVKISRYMRGFRTIGRVIIKHRSEIIASFLILAQLVFLASIAMYEIENPAQPTKFDSPLTGIYWAVTTITATGYGDLAPITDLGRLVGSLLMFLSVGLVAIPGGIFSAGFVAEFQNANRPLERREELDREKGVVPEEGEDESFL